MPVPSSRFYQTNNIIATLKNLSLKVGDVLYFDLDDTLFLSNVNFDALPELTEKQLVDEIQHLRQSGIKVYALTARSSQEVTVAQLKALNIEFDDVLYAPMQGDRCMKGEVLKKHISEMPTRPKRVVMIDDLKEQLEAIDQAFEHDEISLNLYHYRYVPNLKLDPTGYFPDDLSGYTLERSLDDGTYLLTSKDQNKDKLILKYEANVEVIKLDMLNHATYHTLGVKLPRFEAYTSIPQEFARQLKLTTCHGMFKVSEYLEAQPISAEKIKSQAKDNFLVHVLLGNNAIANLNQFIYSKDDVYIKDVGANFIYQASGDARQEIKEELTELDSLRKNEWFGKLTDDELKQQGKAIFKKLRQLEQVAWTLSHRLDISDERREEYLRVFANRLEELSYRVNLAEELGARKEKEAKVKETSAGILTYRLIAGKPHVLLSKRDVDDEWANFGGKSEAAEEKIIETAIREVKEESNGLLLYTQAELNQCPFHDLVSVHEDNIHVYRMFIAEYAKDIDLQQLTDHEHLDHVWVSVADLMTALQNPEEIEKKTTCKVKLEDKEIVLFPEFYQMLAQHAVSENLQHLVKSNKVRKTQTQSHIHQQIPSKKQIFATPENVRATISKALLSHSHVLREFKKKNQVQQEEIKERITTLSQSELHLKAVLKDKYKENDVRANVETMLEAYFDKDILSAEDKERVVNQCIKWIENEKRGGDEYLYFYHGCDAKVAFVYEIYRKLYEGLRASTDWPVFRAEGHYFEEFSTIADLISSYQNKIDDCDQKHTRYAFSTNIFLFGNHNLYAECSMLYMLRNFTIRNMDLEKVLTDVLYPFRISPTSIQQVVSLYEPYVKQREGALYQLALLKVDADKLSYAAQAGGDLNHYEGTYNLIPILNQLITNADSLTEKQYSYIETLQTRLMLPPTQAVKCDKFYRKDPASGYDQALAQAVDQVLNEVLNHLTLKNRHHLQATLPLFQHSLSISKYNQLPEGRYDTLLGLTKAVLRNDDAAVIEMLTAHPEWKEAQVKRPSFYLGSKSKSSSDMKLLQFIMHYADLKAATMTSCFGDDWWQQLQIDETKYLIKLLNQCPSSSRLAIATYHQKAIYLGQNLCQTFNLIDKQDKLSFAKAIQARIQNGEHVEIVLDCLNEEDRFDFALTQVNKVQNSYELYNVLRKIKIDNRLKFLSALPEQITNLNGFFQVLKLLNMDERPIVAKAHQNNIRNGVLLRIVLATFAENDRLSFAIDFQDRISNGVDLAEVISTLKPEDKLEFAKANASKIQENEDGYTSELAAVISELGKDDKLPFAIEYENKILDDRELYLVLCSLEPEDQLKFAVRHQEKIKTEEARSYIANLLKKSVPASRQVHDFFKSPKAQIHACLNNKFNQPDILANIRRIGMRS